MGAFRFLITWTRRLPWKFTVPLLVALVAWLALIVRLLREVPAATVAHVVGGWLGLEHQAAWLPAALRFPLEAADIFLQAVIVIALFLVGVVVSYNVAAWICRRARRRPTIAVHAPAAAIPGSRNIISEFKRMRGMDKGDELRIGIICAGGGAKGAYQAGALRAIYEFLEDNNALDSVRMIAGTSIGSWNAMFWLAGLVKRPQPDQASVHELWWQTISLERIVEFANYVPLTRNYLVHSTPWRQLFDEIFFNQGAVEKQLQALLQPGRKMHFYFTRANVEQGHLEFATNNVELPERTRRKWKTHGEEPLYSSDLYEVIEDGDGDGAGRLGRVKDAVFASMDLPPLFPYMRLRTDRPEWFEDGGVVDNLPIRFGTEVENCHLLFVLPLNASFEKAASQTSLFARLFRVMDIRQGVLERNSIKLARLYNEKAALARRATGQKGAPSDVVSIFSICPDQPLSIGTTEFWKAEQAAEAFDLMYAVTKKELNQRFIEATDPEAFEMTLVSPQGSTRRFDEF
jgi:predicted acylesterase/phospholipase RssA